MDPKLLYLLLSTTLLFASGAALAAAAFAARARFIRWWAYAGVKLGLTATNLILLVRVFQNGEVEPTTIAYAYTSAMFTTAVFLTLVAGDMARRAGRVDADYVVSAIAEEQTRARFTDIEGRVTAEELRNDASEQRSADHAGEHSPPAHEP